ncbi:alpha-amylase 4N-like [Pollicipes pollicipes]|uniref:alpha-amylase 4N-like n=1 Tax=Pollicipes pollicipes TaxID=41117 RepID=UPI001884AA7D|nr:alpha-amylase 4N-like [Pollicipes pollicipes]
MSPLALLLGLLAAARAQYDPHNDPDRQAMVHLFEWKFSDIADECERFLGPKGYAGVQISPPHECIIGGGRPWWERYQPVSYQLVSRSGSEDEMRDMVARCNAVGVRIYVDVVVNHMTGGGSGSGTGGSHYDTNGEQYPGVPYGHNDFNDNNCHSPDGNIDNYQDANQVRNCRLSGLRDLNQGTDYVRGKIREYLNHLLSLGVAGFRMDAAKHMWPGDLQAIFSSLRVSADPKHRFDLSVNDGRPFIVMEVIDHGGEPIKNTDYTGLGRVTEFHHCDHINRIFRRRDKLAATSNWGTGWGMLPDNQALVFVDNHDNQRDAGGTVITYKESRLYKMAQAFVMAQPYAFPRIMSSYAFDSHDQGPPSDGNGNIVGPTINADGTCGGGWVCEHRWRQIYNMVAFRDAAVGAGVSDWWSNSDQQIAFARKGKAFIAINNQGSDMNQSLQTSLPAGSYCDVISGNKDGSGCTGKTITVGCDGKANISIGGGDEDPMVAIHVNAKL